MGAWLRRSRARRAASSLHSSPMTTSTVHDRRPFSAARSYVRELWARREFAAFLAVGNLKARNASTALGVLWWIINPVLLAAVYFFVFGVILDVDARGGQSNYLAYLLAGMFAFHFTSGAMNGAAQSILGNARLLANLDFPRLILPLSSLVESFVGFLASLGAFYLIVGPANGVYPGGEVIIVVPVLVLHVLFNLGLAALTARLVVPFRDLNNLVPYVLRLWLYLSPIIWPLSFLDSTTAAVRTVVQANPLFPFLGLYRGALTGSPIETWMWWSAVAWAFGVALVGLIAFVRYEKHMVRHL